MRKIGVIFGMENTFPGALVERIHQLKADGVTAEFVKVGGVRMAEPSGYRVIVDRISHDIPFGGEPTTSSLIIAWRRSSA